MTAMRYYKLPAPVLKGILDYLETRPYREVAAGVRALEQLEPLSGETKAATEAADGAFADQVDADN